MCAQKIDTFANHLKPQVQASVYNGSSSGTQKRLASLSQDYPDPNHLRDLAGKIKQHTLDHLDTYLLQAEQKLTENGAHVHYAWDTEQARHIILDIFKQYNAKTTCKSKSMATEEIYLNDFLEENGIEVLETDLGEFILQIEHEHPSHVVKPIIHKNRDEIAASFAKHGLGEFDNKPKIITQRARQFMRKKYLESDIGITGGNFISAESGRLVLVTNEGNSRFLLASSNVHIALIGIEKIVPKDRDLSVFLNLLGRSTTGQQLTVYTEFINGPRAPTQAEASVPAPQCSRRNRSRRNPKRSSKARLTRTSNSLQQKIALTVSTDQSGGGTCQESAI